MNLYKSFLILILFLTILGCNKKTDEVKSDSILRLYNWEEYIGSETIKNFENETGIKVEIIHYEDEEQMFASLRSNPYAYDLVVASDDLIREMILAKTLLKIDKSKLTNLVNISPKYLDLDFDKENNFSVPYLWGTTGIVINSKYIDEESDSWNLLFNEKYKNRVAMLNNSFEVFAAASKSIGNSINQRNREELDNAYELLLKQKKINRGYYDVFTITDLLLSEDIWAGQVYSGEGLAAADKNQNLEYIIPLEGAPIWLDSFVIPRFSNNSEEAHTFINYILRPEVIGKIASELWYATPNSMDRQYIDPEVLESESVYPSESVLRSCEYYTDIGELSPYLFKRWSELTSK